jgi:hypothetical protein
VTLNAADHPKLLEAVRAALRAEAPTRAALDPNHSPFGHVRLSARGGGYVCGLCGVNVVAMGPGEWRHR